MATYLEFEKKIEQIQQDIDSAKARDDKYALESFEEALDKEVTKTFGALSDYQKLQLARHPDRPYALDYIRFMMRGAYEIHGDRAFRDDPAILCYIGYIDGQKTMLIGEQKGRGTKHKLKRNFGMPNPEGYRKALRLMKMAEKFSMPVITFIDTPGAYPGIGAEERGQSEAIAKNLFEMSTLATPIISVVIGEGGSGGALAIGVADIMMMFEYSIYSVISPEGCASILYKDAAKANIAAESLKLTSKHLKKENLVDVIIAEPLGGIHRDPDEARRLLKNALKQQLEVVGKMTTDQLLQARAEKLLSFGKFKE